ncbi:FAH family protein [Actinokineospora xionganensis]|uniref:FAH family protein n=1 Tax=Actinokineospora xionganensis TaxID=2684470 RepID=A0ABR7L4Q1_9PSEU|nr:FAH family protein [Actinokineospora xionganensis]MBC6447409.1 FAH family protein [Actinokineospora xionganensis]
MRFFECEYQGGRHVGFDPPADTAVVHPIDGGVLDLLSTVDSLGDLRAAAGAGRTVPTAELSPLPPLRPASVGDLFVSGYAQTHHGKAGVETPDQPTWFFRGLGDVVKLPGDALTVPTSVLGLGEEAEVVLVYLTGTDGKTRYVGFTFGNDLTDIGKFVADRGHLGYAKLTDCSVSPWLFSGPPPATVNGEVAIERGGQPAWKGSFTTGTAALRFDLDTMIDHLLSYPALRHPGRVHYVFLGADRGSFQDGFRIADGDQVTIDVTSHDVQLSNTIVWATQS